MYEDLTYSSAYWRLEWHKMQRATPRRPSITGQLVNSLTPPQRADLWNSFERIDRVAGDPVTLGNMRRAAERHPAGALRLLVLGAIDAHLNRRASLTETRHSQSGRRVYLEYRPTADMVSVR